MKATRKVAVIGGGLGTAIAYPQAKALYQLGASWKFADQIIAFREISRQRFPNYTSGSSGPVKAIELLAKDGRQWWS